MLVPEFGGSDGGVAAGEGQKRSLSAVAVAGVDNIMGGELVGEYWKVVVVEMEEDASTHHTRRGRWGGDEQKNDQGF